MLVTKATFDEVVGTSFQGRIQSSFDDLVDLLGSPHYLFTRDEPIGNEPDKVRCEWHLKIDGIVVTIYDWKTDPTPIPAITEWHIGGNSIRAVNKFIYLQGMRLDQFDFQDLM